MIGKTLSSIKTRASLAKAAASEAKKPVAKESAIKDALSAGTRSQSVQTFSGNGQTTAERLVAKPTKLETTINSAVMSASDDGYSGALNTDTVQLGDPPLGQNSCSLSLRESL